MSLFNNLSDKLEQSKVDFSFDDDSDLGLDEVALDNFNASPPPLHHNQLPLRGPIAPKNKGNLIGARMLALTIFKDA